MQSVSGFEPDSTYTVHFQQAVVKQENSLDSEGARELFLDNRSVGISAISTSNLAFHERELNWENRSISFTATATTHTLKFMPFDNDPDWVMNGSLEDGGLRMGIDEISLITTEPCDFSFSLGPDALVCEGKRFEAGVDLPDVYYFWEDGTQDPIRDLAESGTYWLEVSSDGCSHRDTLVLEFVDCTGELVMSNVFTPKGDGYNDLFVPKPYSHIAAMKTTLYDRWGRRL